MNEVRRYQTEEGRTPFTEWLSGLRNVLAKAAVLARIERLKANNFGKCHLARNGTWELVIDFGPGYRVYYAKIGEEEILLLWAGDKSTQQADISKAVEYLEDFKKREGR